MNRLQYFLSLDYLSAEELAELIENSDLHELDTLTKEQLVLLESLILTIVNMENDFFAEASIKKPKITTTLLEDVRSLIKK